ncbi:MAG: sensor histidine kinase, partial [Luteibaculum sp.]
SLTKEQALHIYRIMQEWISNILRYNSAKEIFLQIIEHEDEISLLIEDDGHGFNTDEFTKGQGNGYRTISSRLDILNANMHIDSNPKNRGSHFEVNIPILKTA